MLMAKVVTYSAKMETPPGIATVLLSPSVACPPALYNVQARPPRSVNKGLEENELNIRWFLDRRSPGSVAISILLPQNRGPINY